MACLIVILNCLTKVQRNKEEAKVCGRSKTEESLTF